MFTDQRVLVTGAMGLSGRAISSLLLRTGAIVGLSDRNDQADLPEEWKDHGNHVDLRPKDGPELIRIFSPDAIITAPGVPLRNEIFHVAKQNEIPIYGENDIASRWIEKRAEQTGRKSPIFAGITGTDGKSTTVAFLTHLINEAGLFRGIACGNYGKPLSDFVLDDSIYDGKTILVVECSSYQLEPQKFFHPAVAAVLNVARDHLDRYESMEQYLQVKLKIGENQGPHDFFFAPGEIAARAKEKNIQSTIQSMPDLESLDGDLSSGKKPLTFRDEKLPGFLDHFSLPGKHNFLNALYAMQMLEKLLEKISPSEGEYTGSQILAASASFQGLPHRMEVIGRKNEIMLINDSKATTVQSVRSAILSMEEREVYLLIGGRDKGGDFRQSLKGFSPRVRFYPFGEAAKFIQRELDLSQSWSDLQSAFRQAIRDATESHSASRVVILSPGCNSFDAYQNYEKRGEHFRSLVEEWLNDEF